MFAFDAYSRNKRPECENEWRSKNIIPILYAKHWRHAYLHRTLREWARMHRDGVRGKERIVMDYAARPPSASSVSDNFVQRMMWALSDASGLPAKRFANFNPAPSLDWLSVFDQSNFRHADLRRFGVAPTTDVDDTLEFSLVKRPAPYRSAPQMALVTSHGRENELDEVMGQLAHWLIRHLDNPDLLYWVVENGGRLHGTIAGLIQQRLHRLADLERRERQDELARIREISPDAIPSVQMRTLWGLLLADKTERSGHNLDLHRWIQRFEVLSLTGSLRMELHGVLSPRVSLRKPFRRQIDGSDLRSNPTDFREVVDWDIVLSTSGVRETLPALRKAEYWGIALPELLDDFTGLLRDALDLMRELGAADDSPDCSFVDRPSISDHSRNWSGRDWTALIELCRDAWQATAAESPERALRGAEAWSRMPYPLFRRLAFYAAAQPNVVPPAQSVEWLLSDANRWLWSLTTKREAMQLLTALAPQLVRADLSRIEQAVLDGPACDVYGPDKAEEVRKERQDQKIWYRLAKLHRTGVVMGCIARDRLRELSAAYPCWELTADDRDEFPRWWRVGSAESDIRAVTPTDFDELVAWLDENRESDVLRPDDWSRRCRDQFQVASSALTSLANNGKWPPDRWHVALQQWSEDQLRVCSWSSVASFLRDMADGAFEKITWAVGFWLKAVASNFTGQRDVFLLLCDRVLNMAPETEADDEEPTNRVDYAINHPIGLVTAALLVLWRRSVDSDDQDLKGQIKLRLERICSVETRKFRCGRVLLAENANSLFEFDLSWTRRFVLPLFEWESSEEEAAWVWEGLLSTMIDWPLIRELKSAFLRTAGHFDMLGQRKDHYASRLTFVALEQNDIFTRTELADVTCELPGPGLDCAAATFAGAIDSASDQRAEYWTNRGEPYLRRIWPNTHGVKSEAVSESFARACIAAGSAFPQALTQVKCWLQPLQHPDEIAYFLRDMGHATRFPCEALELLDKVVRENARGEFPELKACLEAVRTSESALEDQDARRRYRRLDDIVRASEEDPN